MLNFFRNRRIRKIFKTFPNISHEDRRWLIKDLKVRDERLAESIVYMNLMESWHTEKRLDLIHSALEILSHGFHHDSENAAIVRRVYAPVLNKGK